MPSPLVTLTFGEQRLPSARSFESVERKGLGHPDTMADLVAETFCHRYARFCMDAFGYVPNHSADKVTLAGADALVELGGYAIVEPIGAYYFGKVTRRVGAQEIPVEELFRSAVEDVLVLCTRDPAITDHVRIEVKAVVGSPIDHHPGYYNPESAEQLRSIATTERLANDTVACAASSPRTPVEQFVFDLERYLQGGVFGGEVPGTGSDIKVLAARHGGMLDLTMCVPFHPEQIKSWDDYEARLALVRAAVREFAEAREVAGVDRFVFNVNMRDAPGRGYLSPFGTALGKGDIGVVGRGNRYSGLITPGRAMSVEAPAGKNLMHHVGKIYTILAQRIADAVAGQLGQGAEVILTARAGSVLREPGSVCVDVAAGSIDRRLVDAIVEAEIARVDEVTDMLLDTDPLAQVKVDYAISA